MSNKSEGNKIEKLFCQDLKERGFWTHNFQQNSAGQPVDVIVCKNGKAILVDCKLCSSNKGFSSNRVEENQRLSMEMFEKCGNEKGWFLLALSEAPSDWFMFLLPTIDTIKTLDVEEIKLYGVRMKDWCEIWNLT